MVSVFLSLVAIGAALALAGLRFVPEDAACSLHRWGRFRRNLGPGWHWVVPVVDQIAGRVHLIGHRVELGNSRFPQAEVYFQILEPQRTGAELERVDALVEQLAGERLAQLPEAEVRALAGRWKDELNRRLGQLGLQVIRCRLA